MVRVVYDKRGRVIDADPFLVYNLLKRGYSLATIRNILVNYGVDEEKYIGTKRLWKIRNAKKRINEVLVYGEKPPKWFYSIREINALNYESVLRLIREV